MTVRLLNQNNERVGTYSPDKVRLLIDSPLSAAGQDALDELHRRRLRLECDCGTLLHVAQRSRSFLRRNPKQQTNGRSCDLCESTSSERDPGSSVTPPADSRVGLILRTRVHDAPDRADDDTPSGTSTGGGGQKYLRAFGVLFRILHDAGLNRNAETYTWDDGWKRIYDVLSRVELLAGSPRRMSDFAWMPGDLYKGGLRDLNDRLRNLWPGGRHQPEGWVFGSVPEIPAGEDFEVHTLSTRARDSIASKGGRLYPPYRLRISRHQMSPVGRTGPFLALAVASLNTSDPPQYAKPVVARLLLVSVAAENWLLPVESNHERETAFLLRRLGLPFLKPLLADSDGLRPDFLVKVGEQRIVLEVQGMNTDEYRQHKVEVHARIRASRLYRAYTLVTYDPNDGERVGDLERKLLAVGR